MIALPTLTLWTLLAAVTPAQQPTATPAATRYLHVSAPYAQQLVLQLKAGYPEIKKVGLHAVPPGEHESCIIASPITSKIGKVSSPADLAVLHSGQPAATPHAEEGGFFDLALPLHNAGGQNVGLMILEIPYRYASTADEALQKGTAIRDEAAAKIPSKAALFGPAAQ